MTQDFAKRSQDASGGRTTPGWVLFTAGFFAGVFLSFLGYLYLRVPTDPAVANIKEVPTAKPDQTVEQMRWDFYDLFPRSEVPVVEEYNTDGDKVAVEGPFHYLLQAGSFKDPQDADELRAELILMGMDVFVREIDVKGKQWHRVMVGPMETELALNRAQDKLAQAEVESIPIRVKP